MIRNTLGHYTKITIIKKKHINNYKKIVFAYNYATVTYISM